MQLHQLTSSFSDSARHVVTSSLLFPFHSCLCRCLSPSLAPLSFQARALGTSDAKDSEWGLWVRQGYRQKQVGGSPQTHAQNRDPTRDKNENSGAKCALFPTTPQTTPS